MYNIFISDIIRQKLQGIKFGLLKAENVVVINNDPQFEDDFSELKDFLSKKFQDKAPSADDTVNAVRKMYYCIGWEPTRYRPSSEALIRRILKGKGLYRINNLVDYGNLVSAKYHLPMGLYDTERIKGNITFDVGKVGEGYRGISKEEIHAEGKLILRDDEGIFGNPTADSLRTSIQETTKSALAVFFCPPEIEDSYLGWVLDTLGSHYAKSVSEIILNKEIFKP
jgi:DNA/RNA-binding domain of Phe-tRNA-synthetase-like protein